MLIFIKLTYSQVRVWDLQAKIKVVKGKLRKPITTFFHHFSGIFDNRRRGVLLDSTPPKITLQKNSRQSYCNVSNFFSALRLAAQILQAKFCALPRKGTFFKLRKKKIPFLPHYGMSLSPTGSRLKTFVWG